MRYVMAQQTRDVSRRTVLKTTGSAALASGFVGTVTASEGTDRVEVNVGFASQAGKRAAASAADSVIREFGFDAMTIEVAKPAVKGLRKRGDVRYVEPNGRMHAIPTQEAVTTQSQTTPWGVDRVDAEVAHAAGYTGAGADIAVLDTGIDSDHRDLDGNLGAGAAATACSGGCTYDWDDDNGHGTHCAGTVGAEQNTVDVVGVSTQATLHAVKVLGSSGGGSISDIAAGIEYVADQNWDVCSMSLGASQGSFTLRDACEYAANGGVFLVAAAGNSGPCSSCVGYPAAYDEVMAVSATDRYDNLAGFSSTGAPVEIAAPGVEVLSTRLGGGTEFLSGTSMACPHVAGAAGLLIDAGYSPTQVRSRLANTAEDIGLPSNEQGAGLLDVAAALGLDSSDDL
jgi:subtilisin